MVQQGEESNGEMETAVPSGGSVVTESLENPPGESEAELATAPNEQTESCPNIASVVTVSRELHGALQSMESGKTPGIDGIPVEFLKTFWSQIGADLLEVLNDGLLEGGLPGGTLVSSRAWNDGEKERRGEEKRKVIKQVGKMID
ncbi:unnamed protein product, partial [Leuciscus chuanchicus]